MLARVQVEHELPERTFHPSETFFQHDEARAGELGGGLEVHLAETLAEIEMLLRLEAVIVLRPEAVMLDIAALVRAIRHLGQRQVRNPRQRLVELLGKRLGLVLQCRDLGLEPRDLGHQRLRRTFLVALLRRTDFLRRGVAARERGLRRLDGGATALVDREQPVGLWRQAAARQPAVELLLVLANPPDVVHCRVLSAVMPAKAGNQYTPASPV